MIKVLFITLESYHFLENKKNRKSFDFDDINKK